MTVPLLLLDTPPAAPDRPGGLLRIATVLPLPERGEAGIEAPVEPCANTGHVLAMPCVAGQDGAPVDGLLSNEDDQWLVNDARRIPAWPLTVQSGAACASIGSSYAELAAQARRALEISEGFLVEEALWSRYNTLMYPAAGPLPPNLPVLGATGSLVTDPQASVTDAVSTADDVLRVTAGAGMVHAPVALAAHAAAAGLIVPDTRGGLMRTPGGNVWVFGAGYDPAGEPEGGVLGTQVSLLYTTSWVTLYRSEPFVLPSDDAQTFNWATNQREVFSARVYVPMFNPCGLAAIPIDAY